MKEEKNIDDLFRSSFEDFEVAPPAAIKEAIDRQIDARPSRRKTWLLLLLVLLTGSGVFAYIYTTSSASDNTPQTAQTHTGIASTQSSTPGSVTNGATTGSSAPGTRAATGSSSGASTTPAGNTAGGTTIASDGRSAGASSMQKGGTSATAGKKATSKGSKQASGKKSTSPVSGKKNGSGKKSGGPAASTQGSAGNGKNGQSGGNEGNKTGGDTPSGDPKVNIPPVANPNGGGNNPTTPPNAPTDSVPAKEDPPKKKETLSDSTTDPATQKPKKKKDPDAGDEQWRASVYFGPQLSWGKTTTPSEQQRLSADKSNFQLSGEINRSLFAGYGLSTGLQYSTKRTETFAWNTYVITDSTLTLEWEYIYGNPNFPDSITDSVEVEVWVYDSTGTTGSQVNSISSFGIPLYITKQFAFGENWSLLVNAGAQFNFYNVKLGSADSVPVMQTVHDFGMTLIGRAHLAYQWNQWQFSAGLNTGYDLKLPIVYEGIDRRRYFVTPQIAVHFVF